MAYSTATLTGTYQTWDGTPASGTIEIIPNSPALIDAEGDVILSGRVKVRLGHAAAEGEEGADADGWVNDGSFSEPLPATDDATVEPATGRQYTVVAKLRHQHLKAVTGIELAGGETVDMADVTSAAETTASLSLFLTAEEYAAVVGRVAALEGAPDGGVQTVNGESGAVSLSAADVGADPVGTATAAVEAGRNLITTTQLFANAAAAGKPVIFGHRGAGSLVAPENTLEAFRLGASYGSGCMDGGDLWPLAGSTDDLAVNHNATIDYMTTLAGNISDYTPMSYRNAPVDAGGPTGWFGGTWGQDPTATGGFRSLRSVTYDDILREFGGRIVMTPEVKGTPGTPTLLKQIQRYGLQKSLMPAHFSATQLTQFTAVGCETMWLSVLGTDATMDAVAATGTKFVCFSTSALDATISSWVADGRFTVGIYTINRHWERDKYDALGCKFYYSDSPVYFSKDTTLYRTTRDTFTGGDYFHGHMSNLEGAVGRGGRGYFESGGWLTFPSVASAAADTGTERSAYLGYMAPAASSSFTLDADVRYGTLPTDTSRYAGLAFSCPTDAAFWRTNVDKGYTLILRVNGTLALTYYDGTLAVSGPTKATGAITAGTVAHLQVQVTPTQIIAKRTDAGSTDATALTWTHGGTRGVYGPHVSRTDGSGGLMVVSFKNVIRT